MTDDYFDKKKMRQLYIIVIGLVVAVGIISGFLVVALQRVTTWMF